MVSVMPPSGVGGLPGFPGAGSTSRYLETYYQPQSQSQVSTTGKMASYVHYMRTAKSVVKQPRGRPRTSASASSIANTPSSVALVNAAVKSKCGLQGCTGCLVETPVKWNPSRGDGGPPKVRTGSLLGPFKPLFVDCSVEYELPMVPKIPPDSQPLLVIHPGWQQKRRITRSSSQLMAERQLYCSQCPAPVQSQPHPPAAAASSSTSSRKRSFGQVAAAAAGCSYNNGTTAEQLPPPPSTTADLSAKRARLSSSTSSWIPTQTATGPVVPSESFPCQDRHCIELQRQQMVLMQQHQQQQQQHHQYMLRQQQQQQQQRQQQHQWQQQQMFQNGCPLPLPAPPPPISNRMGPSGGFYGPAHGPMGPHQHAHQHGHHGHHQLYQWHPAYFCPPSAVQIQRQQQQWMAQQHLQQQQHMQHAQLMNNNNCVKCSEGKCAFGVEGKCPYGMMMGPPAQPMGQPRAQPMRAARPTTLPHNHSSSSSTSTSSNNTTTVRYRSV